MDTPEKEKITYESYLRVNDLLSLQDLKSDPPEHDETLFIIIHQVYELWFKQILHEIDLCSTALRRDFLMRVMHALRRVNAIQKILIQQVDILETMIPDDFARFRGNINPASGFQSSQFRVLEFRLGQKDPRFLNFFAPGSPARTNLETALNEPSLYDDFLAFLSRRGFAIQGELLNRDVRERHALNKGLTDVYESIYRNPERFSDLYLGLEALLDLDEHVLLWRYRHVAMVERMIGGRPGTGGSTGAKYLKSTLDHRFFPEIWDVRNRIGSNYGQGLS